ncbi:MAG: PEP/pyruvate-binding domain-containing protein [Candidatus Thermoplasmatota archaeon]
MNDRNKEFENIKNKLDKQVPEALQERVKELNCLYGLTNIVKDKSLSKDEALQKIVDLIPPSWQYPDITCARIKLKDEGVYKTDNFRETKWSQISNIFSDDKKIGTLEVYYLEEKPKLDEGPFLKEERWLIDAIADLIGKYIGEIQIKEELKQHKEKLDQVEKTGQKFEEAEITDKKHDWEVIIDLLIKTDPRMLLRITRKMVYHLYRFENEKINNLLSTVCPVDRDSSSTQWCGINMPNPRQNIESLKRVQQQVFELAKECFTPEELSRLFHYYIKQDKVRPLLLTSQKHGVPLVEITNELIRFFDKADEEIEISPEDRLSITTALIRRFFTDRLDYVNVAKQFINVEDFIPLLKHVVGPAQGAGKLGGKTSGVYLAEKIIKEEMETKDVLSDIAFPRSWYLTSDAIHNFIHYNDLDEVFHHKYLDPEEIRQEQVFLEQIFKNAVFPPEIVENLRKIIHDIDDKPIIVRSSSLLEDSFGAAFSGKYKSLFVPNTGSEEERLYALMDAIAEVYASTFGPDPIEYRRERGLLDFSEEMGVLIQEVVGIKVGKYYMPMFGGVAFSRNEFRWSPRIRREDGVIRLVPGLGTRAVDRVSNDYPILVSPSRPELQVNTLVEERIRYSPHYMDVINLESGAIETIDAIELFKQHPDEFPKLNQIISINKDGRLAKPSGLLLNPEEEDMVVTFSNLFDKTDFLEKIETLLDILEENIGTPVDVEFASDGEKLYFLQCRPQSQSLDIERVPIPKNIPDKRKLFSSDKYVTTAQIENIEYIVYVKPEGYANLQDREEMQKIATIVNRLNAKLPKRKFILMGPGRWGSRGDIKLGVPVKYGDINNTSLLVEVAREKGDYTPELSFGTHFFQDLVEADIKYLPLYPDHPNNLFNEKLLLDAENKLSEITPSFKDYEEVVKIVKVSDLVDGGTLSVIMDGEAGKALAFLKPPDHWSWRMQQVKKIADDLDPEVYSIDSLYLVGSTKDGSAGPGSDIDLIVHFSGNEEQKEKLLAWFDKWNKKLEKENQERTGMKTKDMLDVHIITDEDIKNKTSWATHITSRYKSVREIPIKKDEKN